MKLDRRHMIASVILLTSIGEGTRRHVMASFTQFGTNIIAISPGRTQTHGASLGAINTSRPLSIDDAAPPPRPISIAGPPSSTM